jgi:hypothetical protein
MVPIMPLVMGHSTALSASTFEKLAIFTSILRTCRLDVVAMF